MERRKVLLLLAAAVPATLFTVLGSLSRSVPSDHASAPGRRQDLTTGPRPSADADPAPSGPPVDPAAVDPGDTGDTDAPVIDVLCRDAVRLVAAVSGTASHTPVRVTIHHSAVVLDDPRRAPAQLRAFQRDHQRRGWIDIAYHLAIDPAGNVYELRDPSVPGDSSTAYDTTGHLQLLCLGDFDRQEPTPAMLETLARLIAAECAGRDLPVDTVSAHRDHVLTWCPGGSLAARMDDIRGRAAELRASGAPTLRRLCGPEGTARLAAIESGA